MNYHFKKSFLFVLLSLAYAFSVQAQDADDEAEKKYLKQEFENFIKAYSSIEKTKDKQSVLRYMSPDVKATRMSFDITAYTTSQQTDYRAFEAHLDDLIATEDIQLIYKVTEIPRLHVVKNVGVVVYVVEYQTIKNGNIWTRGNETVTLTYLKSGTSWKIIQYSFVAIEDEKWRGACLCNTYTDATGQYVAQIMIPTGRSYIEQLNAFKFTEVKGERYIKTDKKEYRWAKGGEVWFRSPSGNEQRLGNAFSKEEAVQVILKKHIYPDNCTEIKLDALK